MNSEGKYLRVSAETEEQLKAACETPAVSMIYIDAGCFRSERYRELAEAIHAAGKAAGLRLPQIWRAEAERFFRQHAGAVRTAGFDALLARNFEGLAFFAEETEAAFVLDHTMYAFNAESAGMTEELLKTLLSETALQKAVVTLPLELTARELAALSGRIGRAKELVVYGRVPMMATAQCMRKTALGCDRTPSTLFLRDRTGAQLPVKNYCTWCYNNIFNAVPTVLCDMKKELSAIDYQAARCEFTTEGREECLRVLGAAKEALGISGNTERMENATHAGERSGAARAGKPENAVSAHRDTASPRGGKEKRGARIAEQSRTGAPAFTRGYFKRGVE